MMLRQRSRKRAGTTIVEMACMKMVVFVIFFAVFEYGRFLFVRQVMTNAAREGARVAVVTPTSYLSTTAANASVDAAVRNAMATVPVQPGWTWTAYESTATGANTGTAWTSTPFGSPLMVQVDADFQILFPGLSYLVGTPGRGNTIHITTYCMMYSEAN